MPYNGTQPCFCADRVLLPNHAFARIGSSPAPEPVLVYIEPTTLLRWLTSFRTEGDKKLLGMLA